MIKSRTWWGNKFIEALSGFMEDGRLSRGKSYSGPNRVLEFSVQENLIKSKIRGNINLYFGVYKEPRYRVSISINKISQKKWPKIINAISHNAGMLSRLMLGEIPTSIEDAFSHAGSSLLPKNLGDLVTDCSCPDYANPCKHIAGTYFKLASLLDTDPFLLFELRGILRQDLIKELKKTPLGMALASSLSAPSEIKLAHDKSFYEETKTIPLPPSISLKNFFGKENLEISECNSAQSTSISAIIIKKQNDYPAFWPNNASFIAVMEDIYTHIRKKNRALV